MEQSILTHKPENNRQVTSIVLNLQNKEIKYKHTNKQNKQRKEERKKGEREKKKEGRERRRERMNE